MDLINCKWCGRVVAGGRKVGEAKMEVRIEPMPHLEDQTAQSLTVCAQAA